MYESYFLGKITKICQYYEFMLDRQIKKIDVISIRDLNEMKVLIFKISKDKQNNNILRPKLYLKFIFYFFKNQKQTVL